MLNPWRPLATLGLAAMLTGCQLADLRSLDGTEWRAVKINDVVPPAGQGPTLKFEHGGLTIKTPCTTFSAAKVTIDLTVDPHRFALEGGGGTTMQPACFAGPEPQVEVSFSAAFGRVEFIDLEGAQLVLKGAGGAIVFAQVGPSLPLT